MLIYQSLTCTPTVVINMVYSMHYVMLRGHKPYKPRIHVVLVKGSEKSDCSSGNSQVFCTCRPCCLHQSIAVWTFWFASKSTLFHVKQKEGRLQEQIGDVVQVSNKSSISVFPRVIRVCWAMLSTWVLLQVYMQHISDHRSMQKIIFTRTMCPGNSVHFLLNVYLIVSVFT